jgi:two-component system, OmpR family, response regulator TctD
MKLLLIEDDPASQATLQRTLERRGMRVTTCGDGLRALERWRAGLPDAVLLDLSLPGLDGLQLLAQARAGGLDAPVIVLIARGTVVGLDATVRLPLDGGARDAERQFRS